VTGTPVGGLAVSRALALVLLWSGQVGLALSISVLALVLLYTFHSVALLRLPRANPELAALVTAPVSRGAQRAAALFSIASMGGLVLVQAAQDAAVIAATPLAERLAARSLTTIELAAIWILLGALVYRRPAQSPGELRRPPPGEKMPA
jgi:hypothetical protein